MIGGSGIFDCPVCGHKSSIPATHGDYIRSMNDKGLAELLTIGTGGFFCMECMKINGNECDGCCTEHCEKWLGEPMREGEQ